MQTPAALDDLYPSTPGGLYTRTLNGKKQTTSVTKTIRENKHNLSSRAHVHTITRTRTHARTHTHIESSANVCIHICNKRKERFVGLDVI